MHGLAPAVIGYADHRDVADSGVLGQHGLDLGRKDVLAAGDDHVAKSIDDGQVAGRVDGADVASPVEPVRRERVPCRLPVVPVARQRRSPADLDLAAFTEPYLPAQRRTAGGAQQAGPVHGRLATAS